MPATTLEAQFAHRARQLDAMQGFVSVLAGDIAVDEVMVALADHVAVASDAVGAGVTVVRGDGFGCAAPSNDTVAALERVMLDEQEGPAIDAAQRRTVQALDVTIGQFARRWPAYARVEGVIDPNGGRRPDPVATARHRSRGDLQSPGGPVDGVRSLRGPHPRRHGEQPRATNGTSRRASSNGGTTAVRLNKPRIDIEQAKGIAAVMLNTYTEDAFQTLATSPATTMLVYTTFALSWSVTTAASSPRCHPWNPPWRRRSTESCTAG